MKSIFPGGRFLIIALILVMVASYDNRIEEDESDDDAVPLQRGRTRRTVWLDKKRRLILPPDTSLSITPILAFPIFKQSSTWMAFENLQIEWTFLVLFQGLGWTSEDHAWPFDVSFLVPNRTNVDEDENDSTDTSERRKTSLYNNRPSNTLAKLNHHGCGRSSDSIPVMALPTHTPGGERATLFPRIEKLLSSFGINGRACLKRAVCEVHEIPMKNGFGMVGEFITLFLSVSESAYAKSHLPRYLNAERAGKLGDCSKYYNKCPYSIFTSK